MKLLGKVAIVTGGSGNLGSAIVEELAKEGADVVFTYYNDSISAGLIFNKVKKYKSGIQKLRCDVKNFEKVNEVVNFTINKFKKIDILVNNAGTGVSKPFTETTKEIWDNTIDTNLGGTYNFSFSVVPHMIEQNSGRIVNISSVIGILGVDYPYQMQSAFGASKAGIIGLTKVLGAELGKYNINVNCIAPGGIQAANWDSISMKKYASLNPQNKLIKPEEIAKLVVYLSSADSDSITGETIFMDNGRRLIW